MAKAKIIEGNITDLVFDDKNFNKGSEYGNGLMEKSFNKFAAGRGVLVDKNNRLIAGNKSTEKFGENGGQKIIIVETTGDTLVVTKRTDIDLDTAQGREMALADNQTAVKNIVLDAEVIEAELGEAVCEEWGIQNAGYSIPEKDPFEDEGIEQKNKFGVIVMCETESDQQSVYSRLIGEGFNCKIVVV